VNTKTKPEPAGFREPAYGTDLSPRESLDKIVERLLAVAVECGVDPALLLKRWKSEVKSRDHLRTRRKVASVDIVPNDLLCRIIQRWHLDADFLDFKGFPRLLTCRGKHSLQRLLSKIGSSEPVDVVWREIIRSGVVETAQPDRIRVLTRMLIGTRERRIATALSTILGALSTIEHNLKTRDFRLLYCHRIVTDSFVPESRLREFADLLERQASAALGSIDEWCNNARANLEKPEKLLPIKVHFFLAPNAPSGFKRAMRKAVRAKASVGATQRKHDNFLHSSSISFVPGIPARGPSNEIVAKFAK